MYRNYPFTVIGKTVCIDIEVVDSALDYNILLGHNYIYVMSAMASTLFHKMSFPHNGKIVMVDQLTYYEPRPQSSPDSIISSTTNKQIVEPLTILSLGVYKDSALLGAFCGPLLSSLTPNHREFSCYKNLELPISNLLCLANSQLNCILLLCPQHLGPPIKNLLLLWVPLLYSH